MKRNLKQERLGIINKNKETLGGYEMKIIEYNSATDIIVEFQDDYKASVHATYNSFKKGNIKNPYHPEIHNVGYIGQGHYKSRDENSDKTKAYNIWSHMLRRCYDPYYINKNPAYINCYVCDEWHNFQNFAKWYEENYYEIKNEGVQLDKDILCKGNKIYSPTTCIFVPQKINTLILKCGKSRGEYLIGVSYHKQHKKLYVSCNILSENNETKQKFLGLFPLNKEFQAFTCYKNFKENYIKQVADEYKDLIPQKLYEALYKYEVEIND